MCCARDEFESVCPEAFQMLRAGEIDPPGRAQLVMKEDKILLFRRSLGCDQAKVTEYDYNPEDAGHALSALDEHRLIAACISQHERGEEEARQGLAPAAG